MDSAAYDEMRRHYAQLSDGKLLQLSIEEAGELTREALELLREQIRVRGLPGALNLAIEAQRKRMTTAALDSLVQQFRQLPCLLCGSEGYPLNAFTVTTVWGAFRRAICTEETVIGCPHCVAIAVKRANRITLCFGWWAFPWGPFQTLLAVLNNWRAIEDPDDPDPTVALYGFVKDNPGEVTFLVASSQPD